MFVTYDGCKMNCDKRELRFRESPSFVLKKTLLLQVFTVFKKERISIGYVKYIVITTFALYYIADLLYMQYTNS
ncbi:hypothetical protein BEI60_12760 [Eisenbergiella tayi]|nr:hypothetical protein BEI60_12760 [Eisenbergiella tayi]